MLEVGFRELEDAATDLRNKQTVRRPYNLSASILVPNGGSARAVFIADRDADIFVTGINGTIVAPADSAGRRAASTATDYPFAITNAGVAVTGFANDGLTMRILEETNKAFQLSDPINLMKARDYLQPGYFPGRFSRPMPFTRYLRRDDKLTFEFFNADTIRGTTFHFVTLNLSCKKYDPFTK